MPPPPVEMAASKLRTQALQDQLKEKDKIIDALQAEKRSYLAAVAEEARNKHWAKMNKGWRKHNAVPHRPSLYRSEAITEDERGNINNEKVIFVTEYKIAMEKVTKLNAEAGLAEARVETLRAKQEDAHLMTRELIKMAEALQVEVARAVRMRTAESSPEEDQDTTRIDRDTANSDGDVKMGGLSSATGTKSSRLILNPPKRDTYMSIESVRPFRLRLSQPKRERSVSVKEIRPTRLRLSQPKPEKARENSNKIFSGRVLKASTRTRK